MVNVKEGAVQKQRARIQRNLPTMSDDLKKFLELTWTHRKDQTRDEGSPKMYSSRNVSAYNIYSKLRSTSQHSTISTDEFLRDLLTMRRLPEIQASYRDYEHPLTKQLRLYYDGRRATSGFVSLNQENFQTLVHDASNVGPLNLLLSKTFYHFRRTVGTRPVTRIYLNVKPLHASRVMRFILNNLVLNQARHPYITNAKVAAPGIVARADAIVIYLTNNNGVKNALDDITAYQKSGAHNYFEHGAPRTTQLINRHNSFDLKGVATGAEPPFKLDRRNQMVSGISSFGSFRSQVIALALSRTMSNAKTKGKDMSDPKLEQRVEFMDRAVRYLVKAGINPLQPHLHQDVRRRG